MTALVQDIHKYANIEFKRGFYYGFITGTCVSICFLIMFFKPST